MPRPQDEEEEKYLDAFEKIQGVKINKIWDLGKSRLFLIGQPSFKK